MSNNPITNPITLIGHRAERAALVSGTTRTCIFNAIKNKELTALKNGRATIILDDELRRWMGTFAVIGRDPAPTA
jgi:hypothetical protein